MSTAEDNLILYLPLEVLEKEETKGIDLNDLQHQRADINGLNRKLNIEDPLMLQIKDNWYLYNGEYYYFKSMFSAFKFLNELLSSYIAEYMELPTVKYDIALRRGEIVGLLSRNFREQDKCYVSANNLKKSEYLFLKHILNSKNITELRKTIDRMIIKDFYTCLSDRRSNVLCIRKPFSIELATFFDYELSFYDRNYDDFSREFDEYYNPLFVINPLNKYSDMLAITYEKVSSMMKNDDYLVGQFEKMIDFDIEKSLEDLKSIYKIDICSELYNYYVNFGKKRRKELVNKIKRGV